MHYNKITLNIHFTNPNWNWIVKCNVVSVAGGGQMLQQYTWNERFNSCNLIHTFGWWKWEHTLVNFDLIVLNCASFFIFSFLSMTMFSAEQLQFVVKWNRGKLMGSKLQFRLTSPNLHFLNLNHPSVRAPWFCSQRYSFFIRNEFK